MLWRMHLQMTAHSNSNLWRNTLFWKWWMLHYKVTASIFYFLESLNNFTYLCAVRPPHILNRSSSVKLWEFATGSFCSGTSSTFSVILTTCPCVNVDVWNRQTMIKSEYPQVETFSSTSNMKCLGSEFIYLSMVYLMMLSLAETIYHWLIGWPENNELKIALYHINFIF
jgi:hypothetical protein